MSRKARFAIGLTLLLILTSTIFHISAQDTTPALFPILGHQSPGKPEQPFPALPEWNIPGFLEYDRDTFNVFSLRLHQWTVTIAFEKTVSLSLSDQRKIASFALATWDHWWHIFGGFPWSSYTWVFRNDPINAGTETGIGAESNPNHLFEGVAGKDSYMEFLGHGIFHAWLGWGIRDAHSRPELLNYEKWAVEGITQYYGGRAGGPTIYDTWMDFAWFIFQNYFVGTRYDIPLYEAGSYYYETGDVEYALLAYRKGALVAYMIDERLVKMGLNLNHLLRYMYNRYGLTRQTFTTEDVLFALEKISGKDWDDFFSKYVYSTVPLPLNGTFRYFLHL